MGVELKMWREATGTREASSRRVVLQSRSVDDGSKALRPRFGRGILVSLGCEKARRTRPRPDTEQATSTVVLARRTRGGRFAPSGPTSHGSSDVISRSKQTQQTR